MKNPKSRLPICIGLLATLSFSFGFAFVTNVQSGPSSCCTIEATPSCSEGIGVWMDYQGHENDGCYYVPDSLESCPSQIPPQCF